MSTWRDSILQEFAPQVSRLTLVADPDGLLLDEGIIHGIRERGFDVIEFDDHVAFRFAYESSYRSAWDRGKATDLVVVLRSNLADLASLPYDFSRPGGALAFNLPDLFPNLCTSVVAALDRADLDKLWVAQEQFAPGVLGENATKDFLLRHVFEVAAELITEPSDLLRVLLRRHYRSAQVPAILDKRLLVLLQQSGRFRNWPLDQIVPDRLAFFRFLQERWPAFVQRLAEKNDGVAEPSPGFAFEFDGPTELPFDHADVRAHVSNLFAEGLLRPIEGQITPRLGDHWALVGVSTDPARDAVLRMGKLLDALRETLPGPDARPSGVADLRPAMGALRLLEFEAPFETLTSLRSNLDETALTVDSAFQAWVLARYASLHSQPARPPVMVHHVARVLAFDREKTGAKVALVVIDGLSLDQWLSLRASLLARDQSLAFTDGAVFAWVPTLTSVSRQAIFAGRAPLYFPDSLLTTDKEPQFSGTALGRPGAWRSQRRLPQGPRRYLVACDCWPAPQQARHQGSGFGCGHRRPDHARNGAGQPWHARADPAVGRGRVPSRSLHAGARLRLRSLPHLGPREHRGCRLRSAIGGFACRPSGRAQRASIRTPHSETSLLHGSQDLRRGPAWACKSDSMPFLPPRGRHSFRPTSAQWPTVARQSKSWSCPSSASKGSRRSRFDEVGMSQPVRLEWFERTAQLALAGLSRPEIETELKVLLEDKLSVGGSAIRGNREKVITILQRTWLSVDGDLEPLRLDGLQLIRELPHAGHSLSTGEW